MRSRKMQSKLVNRSRVLAYNEMNAIFHSSISLNSTGIESQDLIQYTRINKLNSPDVTDSLRKSIT